VLVSSAAVTVLSCHHSRSEYPKPDWAYAFVDTCLDADIDTSKWQLIETENLTFRIPPGYVRNTTDWFPPKLEFDRGEGLIGCCVNCEPYAAIRGGGYVRCLETVHGRETFIIRGLAGNQYLTAATWINSHKQYLELVVKSPDADGQKEALAVVRSASIKRQFDKRLPGPIP
jgi:hypothetical protein